MAADRTDNGNPVSELPELSGQVRPVQQTNTTLASRLGPTVDRIRQLYTSFGIRPYRVFLVHMKWPGGQRGHGVPQELSRREILPTPRLLDMSGTTQVLRAFGLQEEGSVAIDQITPKYTEDDLLGKTPDLIDLEVPRSGPPDVDFFWEVVENRPSTPQPVRRRYVPNSVPCLVQDGFQWKITLTKQEYNRGRGQAAMAGRPGRHLP